MDRSNPYEQAFEAYLQAHGMCYVAVDETRRALWEEAPLKSLDFIVHGPGGARLLVDVKGRRYPGGTPGHWRRVWECWATGEDIRGLETWAALFGPDYLPLLVFLYQIHSEVELPHNTEDLWTWQENRYLVRAVSVDQYRRHLRVRSPRWSTVTVSRSAFRQIVRPFRDFALAGEPAAEEVPF